MLSDLQEPSAETGFLLLSALALALPFLMASWHAGYGRPHHSDVSSVRRRWNHRHSCPWTETRMVSLLFAAWRSRVSFARVSHHISAYGKGVPYSSPSLLIGFARLEPPSPNSGEMMSCAAMVSCGRVGVIDVEGEEKQLYTKALSMVRKHVTWLSLRRAGLRKGWMRRHAL